MTQEKTQEKILREKEKEKSFFYHIKRPELKEKLTLGTPYAYISAEMYLEEDGLKGAGGLGILAGDTLKIMEKAAIASIFITIFYTREKTQELDGLEQRIIFSEADSESRGFERLDTLITVQTILPGGQKTETPLKLYQKQKGSVRLFTITEPNIGELYQGANNSDHRLYQDVALGFGGWQIIKKFNLRPPIIQLNEAATVFSALAYLDELMMGVGNFEQALNEVRSRVIYTNHTLVQAAEADFSLEQFKRFVFPNIQSQEVKNWTRSLFKNNKIKSSMLALELAGKKNGVSLIHAREASKSYKDSRGGNINFENVTNGIAMDRWGDPQLIEYYREAGVIDEFGIPTENFKNNIERLNPHKLEEIKKLGQIRLREFLKQRRDQYNLPIEIPEGTKIINWKRRIAGYKRPGMAFERPHELARILEENNAYFIIAGQAHQNDRPMQEELKRILLIIDVNPILRKRAHFVKNYDESLARMLAQGADISLNTPRVRDEETGRRISTEACGTSGMKDAINRTILISTPDGWMADWELRSQYDELEQSPPFLQITGNNNNEEITSLYQNIKKAMALVDDAKQKDIFLKRQLAGLLPIISGSRMLKEYLDLGFPSVKNS